MGVVTGRYSVVQVDPATAESRQPKWPATAQQLQRHITFCDCLPAEHMSAGGEEFETPPPSPNYSPQPSDDEDEESDDQGGIMGTWVQGIGWWQPGGEIEQRESERQERCIRLANQAHIDLIHALPEDICPTLTAVLEYTEWLSLGDWHLFESDVHALARIVENFLVPGGIN